MLDQAHLGVATGVLTFLRSLGGALGVAVLGAIALGKGLPLGGESLQVASSDATSATPFVYIFLACTTAMTLSLVLFLLSRKGRYVAAPRAEWSEQGRQRNRMTRQISFQNRNALLWPRTN